VVGSAGLYFYANDTYYRPRPDLGGYEVVNDPVDSAPAGSSSGLVPVPAMATAPAAAGAAPPGYGAPANYGAPVAGAAMMAAPVAASASMMAAAPGALAAPASASMGAAAPGAFAGAATAGQFPSHPVQMVSLTPNNGQTPEQQARDRYECYRWAFSQSGFDPLHPKTGLPAAQASEQESAYDRVRTACLQQRGYTVQ